MADTKTDATEPTQQVGWRIPATLYRELKREWLEAEEEHGPMSFSEFISHLLSQRRKRKQPR